MTAASQCAFSRTIVENASVVNALIQALFCIRTWRRNHPSQLDLGDYLPYLVNRVGSIIADQFGDEALAAHGLSIAMWRVIAALAGSGSQRQIDLADLTSTDASTLSRLVSRLVRMGLVLRTRSDEQQSRGRRRTLRQRRALVGRLIPVALAYEKAAIAGLVARGNAGAQALPAACLWQYEEPERYFDGAGSLSNAVSRSTLTGTLSTRSPGFFQVLA